jgi:ATP-binding cassette subfamily F protein 3
MVLEARSGGAPGANGKGDITPAAKRRRAAARRREETAPLRRQIKDAEASIDRLRNEIHRIDAKLADAALYARDPEEATRLAKARAEAARAIAVAEDRWLALSAELESTTAG